MAKRHTPFPMAKAQETLTLFLPILHLEGWEVKIKVVKSGHEVFKDTEGYAAMTYRWKSRQAVILFPDDFCRRISEDGEGGWFENVNHAVRRCVIHELIHVAE